jgi:hypothetical protein
MIRLFKSLELDVLLSRLMMRTRSAEQKVGVLPPASKCARGLAADLDCRAAAASARLTHPPVVAGSKKGVRQLDGAWRCSPSDRSDQSIGDDR